MQSQGLFDIEKKLYNQRNRCSQPFFLVFIKNNLYCVCTITESTALYSNQIQMYFLLHEGVS